VSGLGAEFENDPPERLVIGGHGKPLVATPLLPNEGVAEKERAATEDCPKVGEDDFLVGEALTGLGKAFFTIEGVTRLAGEALTGLGKAFLAIVGVKFLAGGTLTGFGRAFLTIEGVKPLAGEGEFLGFE
jgi:hypothetical protein